MCRDKNKSAARGRKFGNVASHHFLSVLFFFFRISLHNGNYENFYLFFRLINRWVSIDIFCTRMLLISSRFSRLSHERNASIQAIDFLHWDWNWLRTIESLSRTHKQPCTALHAENENWIRAAFRVETARTCGKGTAIDLIKWMSISWRELWIFLAQVMKIFEHFRRS